VTGLKTGSNLSLRRLGIALFVLIFIEGSVVDRVLALVDLAGSVLMILWVSMRAPSEIYA